MRTTRITREGTFQMLWKCESCGTDKLLGVDHRHCPNCGSAQTPHTRYFPGPHERTPTKYRGGGPDVACNHCDSPCSSRDNNCMNCGAPLKGCKQVPLRPSIPSHQGETWEDARRDVEIKRENHRRKQEAYHRPEARKARERARVASHPSSHDRSPPWPSSSLTNPLPPRDVVDDISISEFRRDWTPWIIGTVIALLITFVVALLWKKEVEVTAMNRSWERSIEILQYKKLHRSDWCDSTPGDAKITFRSREIRDYETVVDGQDCQTLPVSCSKSCDNVDNGDSSFSVVCAEVCDSGERSCTDITHQEPIYDDKCSYTVNRWVSDRWTTAQGSGKESNPHWPDPTYKRCVGASLGCEKTGDRRESYTVHFFIEETKTTDECSFPQAKWETFSIPSMWMAEMRRMTKGLVCSSIRGVEK